MTTDASAPKLKLTGTIFRYVPALAVCLGCQNDLGKLNVSATAERCPDTGTGAVKVRVKGTCYMTEGQRLMAQAELPDRTAWRIQCDLRTSRCVVVNLRLQHADRGKPLDDGDWFAWTEGETVTRSGELFTIWGGKQKTFDVDLAAHTFTMWETEAKGVTVPCPVK